MDYDEDLDPQQANETIREFVLPKNHELRMECPTSGGRDVRILLEDGTAEVFGAELQKGTAVDVSGQKLAVYTWTGCTLKVQGMPTVIYEAEETPMAAYLNLHTLLNQSRQDAAAQQQQGTTEAPGTSGASAGRPTCSIPGRGPRVIVVGPTDSGKSTLTKTLLNWAVRSAWEPTFVDLDIGQGTITAPGCIAATPIEAPLDITEGCSALDMPLVYFFGHTTPTDNPELYKFLIDRLAAVLDRRASSNPLAASSGLVINTMGWVEGLGYELQVHAINTFKADVVVVLDADRLHSQLTKDLKETGCQVLKLPKSGGVVAREREERRNARDARLKEYFYGPRGTLMPSTQLLRADQVLVFRVGGGPRAPNSALPIGAVSATDPLRISHVAGSAELVQSVMAVSHAPTPDQALSTNVAGFVLVKDVDVTRGTLTVLTPSPGPLPNKYLITGSLRSAMD